MSALAGKMLVLRLRADSFQAFCFARLNVFQLSAASTAAPAAVSRDGRLQSRARAAEALHRAERRMLLSNDGGGLHLAHPPVAARQHLPGPPPV